MRSVFLVLLAILSLSASSAWAELPGSVDVRDLLGSNGFPGKVGALQHDTTALWNAMGLQLYRHDVLWGEVEMLQDVFDFSPAHPDALDHDEIISTARAGGFEPLLILAFTAPWAATGPAAGPLFRQQFQSYFPPADPTDWLDYVERTVAHYTAPPFDARYFEIWNEPFAEYWQGTREQFVDDILIPAAQIVHAHGAEVVAPAWAGAGPDELNTWLEYNDAWTHVDILSIHFNWADRDRLYDDWIGSGKLEGLWYTEVSGFADSANPFFVADSYPEAVDWFIRRNWDRPDKYKFVYWIDGVTLSTGQFLINQDLGGVFLTDQGKAMRTFVETFSAPLRLYSGTVTAAGMSSTYAFETATEVIVALEGAAAGGSMTVASLLESEFPVSEVFAIDVVEGTANPLAFSQSANAVQIDLPAGAAFRYVTLNGTPAVPTGRGTGVLLLLALPGVALFRRFRASRARSRRCAPLSNPAGSFRHRG